MTPADPLAPLVVLPGVTASAEAARAAIDSMLRHRVLRRRGDQVAAESVLRGAWAAASVAGSTVALPALRGDATSALRVDPTSALRGDAPSALRGDVRDDPILQGALRVYGELASLAATWRVAPRQALARMHLLAASDSVPASALGRPVSPVASARLDTLASVLGATRAPAVVVAAVVYGELLSLDAFAPVSTVVADAALRLTIVASGLDPSSRSVPEVGIRERSPLEPGLLAGFASGTSVGLSDWVAHVGDIVTLGARETVAICEAMQRG